MQNAISYLVPKNNIIPNGILGMLFLIATEMMFFGGLISAYIVNRAGVGIWPPEGQPRLSVEITAFNSALLLISAIMIFFVNKNISVDLKKAKMFLLFSIVLGISFIAIQGSEWVKLLGFGLTTKSGLYGAFFYTIIGAHALHAAVGISLLLYVFLSFKTKSQKEIAATAQVCSLYWYFVAVIWVPLYYLVYLY